MASHGLGQPWGHTRTYGNRVTNNAYGINGNSWFVKQMPRMVFLDSNSPPQAICVYGSINNAYWFDYDAGTDSYVGRYGIKQTLVRDGANQQYILMDTRGRKTVFHGEQVSGLQGKFKAFINRAGYDSVANYDGENRLASFVITHGDNSGVYSYGYHEDGENTGLLKSVTYKLNGADVRRSGYQYFGSEEDGGNLNDLKTVTIEQFDSTSGQWIELSKRHYRYYKSGEQNGFEHGLKYVVGPEAYARMLAASLLPETASDEQIVAYADNYFEYNADKRATLERTHGGAYTYAYTYTERGSSSSSSSSSSGMAGDYNSWKMKTVETLPDGNQNIVYTNYAGQVMLKEFKSGSNSWCEYSRYGEEEHNAGRVVLKAESSAVASYNEEEADLGVVLNNTGLIHAYEYYESTDPGPEGSGAVKGYLKLEKVQHEEDDEDAIKLREVKYTERSLGDFTIYPVWKNIVYQSDQDGGSEPSETAFAYEWFYESFQMLQRTTTLPIVAGNQNGSGVADTRVEIFDDCCGRVLWAKDERGFITHSVYDDSTGALVQRVEDVDTTRYDDAPEGWATPAGGGLNLVTDYTVDLLGRTTQELGPSHQVDLNGTARTIRRARWTVYRDDLDQRWDGAGYAVAKAQRSVTRSTQTQGFALQFDGQQNYVNIPNNSAFYPQSNGLTVECWYRNSSQTPGDGHFVSSYSPTSDGGYGLWCRSGTAAAVFNATTSEGTQDINLYSDVNINDGNWHHIAAVWDMANNLAYLFVDGQPQGIPTDTTDQTLTVDSHPLQFGKSPYGAPSNGTVQEVRISGAAKYTGSFTPGGYGVEEDTIAYYPCNEGSGDTVHDATSNHFDGTLMGDPIPTWVTGRPLAASVTDVLADYIYTLINPVKITRLDKKGRVTDEIQAVRRTGCGELTVFDEFPQSSWTRWAKTHYDDHDNLAFQRVYFDIPEFGEGERGVHYNQTDYGYDVIARRNRVRTPGGTITRTVYHPCDWPLETWVGTDDTGATESDPSGGGASPLNNMVKVQASVYDGGSDGGDGNLTQQTLYENATTTRVTTFGYDFRDRRISTLTADGQTDLFYETRDYDNLDRVTTVDRWDNADKDHLIASSETLYDSRGRVYRTIRYGMDPSSTQQPPTKTPLTDNFWYDGAGNLIKQANAGSRAFQKMVYDGVGRVTRRYTAYDLDESSYAEAGNVTDDIVMQQVELTYDGAGNQVAQVTRDRFHDATGTGPLLGPDGAQPKARVSCAAFWPDPLGRQVAAANYGTNGAQAWARPATIPERSDLVLVNTTEYNERGETSATMDPNGIVTKQELDDAGRLVLKVENYVEDRTEANS